MSSKALTKDYYSHHDENIVSDLIWSDKYRHVSYAIENKSDFPMEIKVYSCPSIIKQSLTYSEEEYDDTLFFKIGKIYIVHPNDSMNIVVKLVHSRIRITARSLYSIEDESFPNNFNNGQFNGTASNILDIYVTHAI